MTKRANLPRLSRKYSGRYSHGFWSAVRSVRNPRCRAIAYAMGCRLQEMESAVLKYVHEHQPNAAVRRDAVAASPSTALLAVSESGDK